MEIVAGAWLADGCVGGKLSSRGTLDVFSTSVSADEAVTPILNVAGPGTICCCCNKNDE